MEEGKGMINILGHRIPEEELKASLKHVVKARGLHGSLILESKMKAAELKLASSDDDYKYANVYKYSFF